MTCSDTGSKDKARVFHRRIEARYLYLIGWALIFSYRGCMCNRLTNFTALKHCSLNSRDVDKLQVPIFFSFFSFLKKVHSNMAEVMDQDDPIIRLLFVDRINQLPMEIFVKILNYLPLKTVFNVCTEVCSKWKTCVVQHFVVPQLKLISEMDPILEKKIEETFSINESETTYVTFKSLKTCHCEYLRPT